MEVRRDRYEQVLTLNSQTPLHKFKLEETRIRWQSHILYCMTKNADEYLK